MYGDGSRELDMILANQKDGGYWVFIEWVQKGCDWYIWVDSDEELEKVLARESAKNHLVKSIRKDK